MYLVKKLNDSAIVIQPFNEEEDALAAFRRIINQLMKNGCEIVNYTTNSLKVLATPTQNSTKPITFTYCLVPFVKYAGEIAPWCLTKMAI